MHLLSIVLLITIYGIAAFLLDRSFILPKLDEIVHSFFVIITSKDFISIVLVTLSRFLMGVLISFILALILATWAFYSPGFKAFMEPLYTLLKSIPNVTYIIVALLWLGRNGSVILVAFLAIFPILYNSILSSYENIDPELIEVTDLYPDGKLFKLWHVYLPLIKPGIILSLQNALTLALRVSVMAEILGQVSMGIGRAMNFAKINYLMADIFAWTIIIIIISALIDAIFKFWYEHLDY